MQGLSVRPRGIEPETAIADLSDQANIGLVLVISGAGVDKADADADVPYCVLVDTPSGAGKECGVIGLGNTTGEAPLRASGAGSKGDWLVAEAIATAAGKTRKLPAAAATYLVYGRAKEDFVDGQLFRAEVFQPRQHVVN